MIVNLEADDLQKGLLGLVVALAEIIKEALRLQAVRRMEGGTLTLDEVDRLGEALMELEIAIEKMKDDLGIREPVRAIREGLDRTIAEMVERLVEPLPRPSAAPTSAWRGS